jgi:hypothetical protein
MQGETMQVNSGALALNQVFALIIQPVGGFRFAYTKVSDETGEAVWRWPREAPAQPLVEARGQLLDVRA